MRRARRPRRQVAIGPGSAAERPADSGRVDDHPRRTDAGSATPLVLGMMACLLVLGAGVTAAGSAFLAGQRLQHLCDGAVAAAAGAVDPTRRPGAAVPLADPIAAAQEYLAVRGPDVVAVVSVTPRQVAATCSAEASIAFGVVFGVPTLHREVTSNSRPIYGSAAAEAFPPAPAPSEGQLT